MVVLLVAGDRPLPVPLREGARGAERSGCVVLVAPPAGAAVLRALAVTALSRSVHRVGACQIQHVEAGAERGLLLP